MLITLQLTVCVCQFPTSERQKLERTPDPASSLQIPNAESGPEYVHRSLNGLVTQASVGEMDSENFVAFPPVSLKGSLGFEGFTSSRVLFFQRQSKDCSLQTPVIFAEVSDDPVFLRLMS